MKGNRPKISIEIAIFIRFSRTRDRHSLNKCDRHINMGEYRYICSYGYLRLQKNDRYK